MANQGRDMSYDSAEMGDEGRNVNRSRAGDQITGQPQLFKDDFTNQGTTNQENWPQLPDWSSSGQGTNYHQQTRNDGYMNQGYTASGNEGYTNQSGNVGHMNQGYTNYGGNDDYMSQGYKTSGNDGYGKQSGNDVYTNQGYGNSGQENSFFQQTGGGIANMAQGAASVAKGAAVGAANIAQGAATAVKNTLGMNTDTSSTADTTTTYHPSNPNSRV